MKKIKNLLFLIFFILLFIVSCGDNKKRDASRNFPFIYDKPVSVFTSRYFVRCWGEVGYEDEPACRYCKFYSENMFNTTYPAEDDTTGLTYMPDAINKGDALIDGIYETCMNGGRPVVQPPVIQPDPIKPSNYGITTYMPNINTKYGYDYYPDEYFEKAYKNANPSYYIPSTKLFPSWHEYYFEEEYNGVDLISLEIGKGTSFTLSIAQSKFEEFDNIDLEIPSVSQIVFANGLQTMPLKEGLNDITIKSTGSSEENLRLAIKGYSDPSNKAPITDNVLNIMVYGKKQIAKNKIAVIFLNGAGTDEMKEQQWWKDYLWKYLGQNIIYAPDSIFIHNNVDIGMDWEESNGDEYMSDNEFQNIISFLENKSSDFANLINLADEGSISLIIVGKWEDSIYRGFVIDGTGISYVTDSYATSRTTMHELLHTPLFGEMNHVNDPINLMSPEYNDIGILRHRELEGYDVLEDGAFQSSQWKYLRDSTKIF